MDYTTQCVTKNEYVTSTSLTPLVVTIGVNAQEIRYGTTTTYLVATSTNKCYNPINVQIFYVIDFIFFAAILAIVVLALRKIFRV